MKQINFLPNRYHEQGVKRKSRIWRAVLVALFGGVCLATAIGQRFLRTAVAEQVDAVATEHTKAQMTNERYNLVQNELRSWRAEAELFTFLRHPWPRTQMLSAIAKLMPNTVSLVKLEIQSVRPTPQASQRRRGRRPPPQAESSDQLSSQIDLNLLREQYGNNHTVMFVTGHTTDTTTIHTFVAVLADHIMFSKAELVSLEAIDEELRENTTVFQLRLVVRPAYGLTNGPIRKENNVRQRPENGDA